MVTIDRFLHKRQEEGNPIRVGMIGAGFMGRGIALQIVNWVPGMEMVAIANRNMEGAARAYREAGVENYLPVTTKAELEQNIRTSRCSITEDAELICRADGIDVVLEVTGTIEYAALLILLAIEHGKHVVMMNAEIDGTLGPILKVYADRAGVVLTASDGDQPGVQGNLHRYVKALGANPVLCGNIKGLHDPYRNPTTQRAFAEKWGQKAHMVTSFADGTKISFEQAIVSNATGMRVGKRGMFGPTVPSGTPLKEVANTIYPLDAVLNGPGLVDYVVGAEPGPGVFVLATHDHPIQKHYLNLYKLGEGPLYMFYAPYHLCHFEAPFSIARAAIFHDATLAPAGPPVVEVVAAAKTDLIAGSVLDGLGHYMTYGLCENVETVYRENLLPIGLAEGCRLKRNVPKDAVLTFGDIDLPADRLCDRLWIEQFKHFFGDLDTANERTS